MLTRFPSEILLSDTRSSKLIRRPKGYWSLNLNNITLWFVSHNHPKLHHSQSQFKRFIQLSFQSEPLIIYHIVLIACPSIKDGEVFLIPVKFHAKNCIPAIFLLSQFWSCLTGLEGHQIRNSVNLLHCF